MRGGGDPYTHGNSHANGPGGPVTSWEQKEAHKMIMNIYELMEPAT